MEEQLVSLEVAKLLKTKGFSAGSNHYLEGPTQSVAQKWLRETKNVHICIYNNACGYGYEICKADNGTHIVNDALKGPNDGGVWDTYEGALEEGLKRALELI